MNECHEQNVGKRREERGSVSEFSRRDQSNQSTWSVCLPTSEKEKSIGKRRCAVQPLVILTYDTKYCQVDRIARIRIVSVPLPVDHFCNPLMHRNTDPPGEHTPPQLQLHTFTLNPTTHPTPSKSLPNPSPLPPPTPSPPSPLSYQAYAAIVSFSQSNRHYSSSRAQ